MTNIFSILRTAISVVARQMEVLGLVLEWFACQRFQSTHQDSSVSPTKSLRMLATLALVTNLALSLAAQPWLAILMNDLNVRCSRLPLIIENLQKSQMCQWINAYRDLFYSQIFSLITDRKELFLISVSPELI